MIRTKKNSLNYLCLLYFTKKICIDHKRIFVAIINFGWCCLKIVMKNSSIFAEIWKIIIFSFFIVGQPQTWSIFKKSHSKTSCPASKNENVILRWKKAEKTNSWKSWKLKQKKKIHSWKKSLLYIYLRPSLHTYFGWNVIWKLCQFVFVILFCVKYEKN